MCSNTKYQNWDAVELKMFWHQDNQQILAERNLDIEG